MVRPRHTPDFLTVETRLRPQSLHLGTDEDKKSPAVKPGSGGSMN